MTNDGGQTTRKTIIAMISIIIATVALTGCVLLLEDSVERVSEHRVVAHTRPTIDQIVVSDYDEFVATILGFITEEETEFQLIYNHHDGEDVQAGAQRARLEIMYEHPLGAFAVANITIEATIIVSYYEVEVEIEYKRTKEQIDSIISVPTERHMMTQLLSIMSEYREEAVIRTNMRITESDIAELVRETYYRNPHLIVMLPIMAIERFPEEGVDRIYEIQFSYAERPRMMRQFGALLEEYILRNAELAVGNTDSEILLSLAESLIGSTNFDEDIARTIHAHGAQNLAATAFGALVRGSAVGEGFAMAFKALADNLGFDCRVVLGYYDGMVHAWNVVLLYGEYYHIDVAMCVVHGLEAGFLKTDADFEQLYTWDRANTVRCEGELTLDDIAGSEDVDEPDDPENLENNDEQNDEEEDQ